MSLLIYCAAWGIKDRAEINSDTAIKIAIAAAKENNYDVQSSDIEVLKVKKFTERGPIRLVWLLKYFQKDQRQLLLDNEFWIVYFYPKGQLEEPRYLGGEFCVLVELHSGRVIKTLEIP